MYSERNYQVLPKESYRNLHLNLFGNQIYQAFRQLKKSRYFS
ncbi:hypothetical protein LEP1GSC005_1345 [Leptospira santarosai str. ST188]|nr:hypothetical protein LEP1GSC005_1345 [Leptospira santarosai str. ST188]